MKHLTIWYVRGTWSISESLCVLLCIHGGQSELRALSVQCGPAALRKSRRNRKQAGRGGGEGGRGLRLCPETQSLYKQRYQPHPHTHLRRPGHHECQSRSQIGRPRTERGCLFFLCLGIVYMFRPNMSFVAPFQEKIVIGAFFLGAILCLSFSWLFHTVYCHSEGVSRVFSKLDYSGIAFLIMGSFVPWLYYSFYCSPQPCFIYLIVVCILGVAAITVSQCDFFATPQYRGVRAGVFVGLGLSGVVPTLHFMIAEGFLKATTIGQMGWLFLMAVLYITGACLYAARIPERFFPGKCDIWFHSHQLFHILVVAGAFVHFHGVSNLQEFRYTAGGGCAEEGGS
ncbi:adiponectin receptor 2 [Labeo rohita]|uniref:Adiponectin receptor 2 n=1 Tax=Labeo rohita TaxID=84645 RepID=A0A498NAF9_LABRO|nr:adiponectin receptor 2 [Labeo rohita]